MRLDHVNTTTQWKTVTEDWQTTWTISQHWRLSGTHNNAQSALQLTITNSTIFTVLIFTAKQPPIQYVASKIKRNCKYNKMCGSTPHIWFIESQSLTINNYSLRQDAKCKCSMQVLMETKEKTLCYITSCLWFKPWACLLCMLSGVCMYVCTYTQYQINSIQAASILSRTIG